MGKKHTANRIADAPNRTKKGTEKRSMVPVSKQIKIAQMVMQGKTTNEINKKLHTGSNTVAKVLAREDIKKAITEATISIISNNLEPCIEVTNNTIRAVRELSGKEISELSSKELMWMKSVGMRVFEKIFEMGGIFPNTTNSFTINSLINETSSITLSPGIENLLKNISDSNKIVSNDTPDNDDPKIP